MTLVKKPTEPQTMLTELGLVRLWRDDLEAIERVLRECAPNGCIETDRYVIDSAAELADAEENELQSFRYFDEAEGLELTLNARRASTLKITEPNFAQRAVAWEVVRLATKHTPKGIFIAFRVAAGLVALGLAVLLFPAWDKAGSDNRLILLAVWTGLSLVAVVIIFMLFVGGWLRPRAFIRTRTRAEAATFWERRREEIWIQVVTAVVSLVLGGVIGYWVNSLS